MKKNRIWYFCHITLYTQSCITFLSSATVVAQFLFFYSLTHSLTHSHILFPHFFCLIYLSVSLPVLLSCQSSVLSLSCRQEVWPPLGLCSVYCPNLRELASKTKSRASETLEVAVEGEEAKQDLTGLCICFSVGCGAAHRRCDGQEGKERVDRGRVICAELHPFLQLCLVHLIMLLPSHFLSDRM